MWGNSAVPGARVDEAVQVGKRQLPPYLSSHSLSYHLTPTWRTSAGI